MDWIKTYSTQFTNWINVKILVQTVNISPFLLTETVNITQINHIDDVWMLSQEYHERAEYYNEEVQYDIEQMQFTVQKSYPEWIGYES